MALDASLHTFIYKSTQNGVLRRDHSYHFSCDSFYSLKMIFGELTTCTKKVVLLMIVFLTKLIIVFLYQLLLLSILLSWIQISQLFSLHYPSVLWSCINYLKTVLKDFHHCMDNFTRIHREKGQRNCPDGNHSDNLIIFLSWGRKKLFIG